MVVAATLGLGLLGLSGCGCWHAQYSGCGSGWRVDSCGGGGDGGLILLGVLGIAWGISALAEACR